MHERTLRRVGWVRVWVLAAAVMALALTPAGGAAQRAATYDGPLENVVLDWNRHAIEALVNTPTGEPLGAGQPPPISSLHLAMVHAAIYDAVVSIDGGYQPYLAGLPAAPPSASQAAAVATAAHDVLVGVVLPTPLPPEIVARLDGARDATLAAAVAADGPASVDAGVAAGAAAAAALLAARANDGRYGPYRFESRRRSASSGSSRATRPRPTGSTGSPRSSRFCWRARRSSARGGRTR